MTKKISVFNYVRVITNNRQSQHGEAPPPSPSSAVEPVRFKSFTASKGLLQSCPETPQKKTGNEAAVDWRVFVGHSLRASGPGRTCETCPDRFGELPPGRAAAVLPRLPKYYNLLLESVYRWKLITSHHRTRIIPLGAPNSVTVV